MSRTHTYADLIKDALSRVSSKTCESLSAQIEAREKVVILDCRETEETKDGVLPGAVLLTRGMLERHIHEHIPNQGAEVCVYSATDGRAALASDTLLKMGYDNVCYLEGGIERWRHFGLAVEGDGTVCLLSGAKIDWHDVRREFAIINRRVPVLGSGERPLVYLDHAASTHAPQSVLKSYIELMEREYANVHRGTHILSRRATERFEEAYYVVADFIGAELRQGCVCFTTNTTQSIDLASHVMAHVPGKVITTEMEHHSNELPHRRRGSVLRAQINDDGSLDLNHLEDLLRRNEIKLVSVTGGSNVTGFMPNIHQIARLAHENGALICVDAAQLLAHAPIDVKGPSDIEHIDFLAGAGHKAYAPFGAGFLYGPRALMNEAPPYLPGGGTAAQVSSFSAEYLPAPDRHQGGTPNIGGVVAMSRAFLFLQSIGMEELRRHELQLLTKTMTALQAMDGVHVYGPSDPTQRLGVISFNVEGVSDMLTAAILSEEGGLAVRNGRFCAHIYMDKLLAQTHGDDPKAPKGAARASFGAYNDESDVERLLEFVGRVREHKWVGHYRTRGDSVSAEFAGRCADQWMESSSQEAEGLEAHGSATDHGYDFEVLQPDKPCRTYLIIDHDTREAALVDPVREEVDNYLDIISERSLELKYTIETHTHADHLSGSARLKDMTGAQMLMHKASPAPCVDKHLQDDDVIELGKTQIRVLSSPGHTKDSICLLFADRVLTGDTLLIGVCGRTDLPSGNSEHMHGSLQRLMELPDETLVFPCHDYQGRRASTIGRERKNNKRIQIGDLETFKDEMANLNLSLPARLKESLKNNTKCL
jgi:cysteine desulfurase / selenocysteine lyase